MKLSVFSIFILYVFTVQCQIKYQINGYINKDNMVSGKIYLMKPSSKTGTAVIVDSTTLNNNQFKFNETLNSNDNSTRKILFNNAKTGQQNFTFFAETGTIQMNIAADNAFQVSGTPLNNLLNNFEQKRIDAIKKVTASTDKYSKKPQTEENLNNKNTEIKTITDDFRKDLVTLTKNNMNNALGQYLFMIYLKFYSSKEAIELIDQSEPQFKNSQLVQNIKANYESDLLQSVGSKYKDFTLKNINDKEVSLSDYVEKSRYVLIDFWASTCDSCIKDFALLKRLYDKYSSQGFEIIGIPLDNTKSLWTETIKLHEITWPQMFDLRSWKSDIVSTYRVHHTPYTILLDKEGTIIAIGLKGEDLTNKINELFQ